MGGGVVIAGEKARLGGLEGWPVRWRTDGGEWFRGGQAGRGRRGLAVRPVVAGGSADGGWRLRGVEFDDKLEALDFVSNGGKSNDQR